AVAHRDRLGDLEIDRKVVAEDRIVGTHQPAVLELLGMDVEEECVVRAARGGELADQAPELTPTVALDGLRDQRERTLEVGIAAPEERLVREDLPSAEIHDWLKDHLHIGDAQRGAHELVEVLSEAAPAEAHEGGFYTQALRGQRCALCLPEL